MRMGLAVPDGCTGKDMEKRFDRGAVLAVVSVATDIVLAWLWKLVLEEPTETDGLGGVAMCSAGGPLETWPFDWSISCATEGSMRRLLREDMTR
jgi:hypothetical protein